MNTPTQTPTQTQTPDFHTLAQMAASTVDENLSGLKKMSLRELLVFGKANGFDSAPGFHSFKRALHAVGIDWAQMNETQNTQRTLENNAKSTHRICLHVEAVGNKYAITDQSGSIICKGYFTDADFGTDVQGPEGDELREIAAARTAILCAASVAKHAKHQAVNLTLSTTSQQVASLSGRAAQLQRTAGNAGVVLTTDWQIKTKATGKAAPSGFIRFEPLTLAHTLTPRATVADIVRKVAKLKTVRA